MVENRTMMNYAAARSSRVVVARNGATLATVTIPKGAFCMVSTAGKWQTSEQRGTGGSERRMGRGHDGMSLHEACYQGRLDVVAQLLANGADPNEPADPATRDWIAGAGNRPKPLNCVAVAWTLTENHVAIARLLIEHGAVVDGSVLEDHAIEMEGSTADLAFRSLLEKAHSR